jgi:beta-lactamase class A
LKLRKVLYGLLVAGLFLSPQIVLPPAAQAAQSTTAAVQLSPRLKQVAGIIKAAAPCRVYFSDLSSKYSFYRGDEAMSSASMIKVFILAKAYQDIADGTLSRNETFTLTSDNVVGGSGTLQGLPYGTKVSLQKVMDTMIIDSDNTATNIMIDRLGMDNINAYMQSHGYQHSVLKRKMMDYDAIAAGRDNLTSVRDVGNLFKRLYKGTCVNAALDNEMLSIYKRQTDNDKIPAGLPAGTVVAHKTGEVNDVRHDGGIVYTPKGNYVLVIFTSNYYAYDDIANLSKRIYDAYTGA